MELLDKGMMYESKVKQGKVSIILFTLLGLLWPVFFVFIGDKDIFLLLIMVSLFMVILVDLIVYICIRANRSKINKIDEMTDVLDEFIVTTQIISKSQESNTNVSGQQGYVSSSTHHEYMVGVRTLSGQPLRIYSKNLYMSSREGEYVDILVKQKLDKNKQVLDSSYIPLFDTIKQSI